jgi:DNA-binding response OmpR family regulator
MEKPRLLLVEDEPVTRMALEARLRRAGFMVTAVEGAEQALALLQAERFALLITDLQLQSLDGVALLVNARMLDPDLEVLVLTGVASLDSAIAAINHGAHTYLRKPASRGELEARAIAALERRKAKVERDLILRQMGAQLLRIAEPEASAYAGASIPSLRVGRLELDPLRRHAAIAQQAVPLSQGEFDLLLYMARRENQVLSAEELAREVLSYAACSSAEARELIKARIHRLRQKIEADPRAPSMIVSIRGVGYMLTSGS